jgi:post-GPI attachment to proteins factor 3
VAYLSFLPRFDYSYNILANSLVGLLHNVLWIIYALPVTTFFQRFPGRTKSYRPSYVGKAAWLVLATMLAMCLELFDFPAWRRVLDAHALWHLATVPIAVFWYEFLIQDALDQGWRDVRG